MKEYAIFYTQILHRGCENNALYDLLLDIPTPQDSFPFDAIAYRIARVIISKEAIKSSSDPELSSLCKPQI